MLTLDSADNARAIGSMALDAIMRMVRLPLCITDPSQPDNPIVYVNQAFLELTGYSEQEVVGRNCRFLQGPNTSAESITSVRRMVQESQLATVDIVNYRKDGTEFINSLQVGPVVDQNGDTILLFGSQLDVTAQRAEELEIQKIAHAEIVHRVRNIVTVMSSIIRTTSDEIENQQEFVEQIIGRLQSLSRAHFDALADQRDHPASAKDISERIVRDYAPSARQLIVEGDDFVLAKHTVTPLTLALHELATNSVKYGALSGSSGTVTIAWRVVDGGQFVALDWRERDGPAVEWSGRSSGSRIISELVQRIGGKIEFRWQPTGVEATIMLPHTE